MPVPNHRVCIDCKQEKKLESFNIIRYIKKTGKKMVCWRKVCRLCRNKQTWKQQFKREHGISVDDKAIIIKKQDGLCAICKIKLRGGKFNHLDHDHKTSKIRGVLCHLCNTSLGHFGDDIDGIMEVVKYLKQTAV